MSANSCVLKEPNRLGSEVYHNDHSTSESHSNRGAAETGESDAQEGTGGARDRTVSEAQYSTPLC